MQLERERFMASEVFFSPSLVSDSYDTPLPDLIDKVIQSSPIDARRALYSVWAIKFNIDRI